MVKCPIILAPAESRQEGTMDAIALRPAAVLRGAATRDALLDAAETLIADHGFSTPSHRMIAGQAGTHVALVNYHFGSKEMLFEAAVERRAVRLNSRWRDELEAMRARPSWSVGDVLNAWWLPFSQLDAQKDLPWSNYLCTCARLASAPAGEAWFQRYFGMADREFHVALAEALPGAAREDLEAGFRYARSLFAEILLYRCGKTGGSCRPRGYREDDVERAMRFIESGLRGVAQTKH
jgi:AcrR family transcriptional regulator